MISQWAKVQPDVPAIIMAGSGETVSFRELDAASNRGAHLLLSLGLKRGDVFALWSGNNPRFLEIVWSMQRAGLYMVPIAAKLNAEEASYIIGDSGARVVIIDGSLGPAAIEFAANAGDLCPNVEKFYSLRSSLAGLPRWEMAIASMPAEPISDESLGQAMIYSSGTTGRPKGVRLPLPETSPHEAGGFVDFHRERYDVEPQTSFIVSAPLYHSGPQAMALAEHMLGATTIVFEKFDPEAILQVIERYGVERGQFVPTMFVRMLKLPDDVRSRYDTSSIEVAIHSAAPCPVDTKHEMIRWWGPVLHEIYGGTENAGSTIIDSHEWLAKPGSVGKAMFGSIHICGDDGVELPPGETGAIFFEGGSDFSYLNDLEKTRSARHPDHLDWASFGDIGKVDEDGYLYLSDRKHFTIIAGGVNIYPQEAENVLTIHPAVVDVAVFGIPDPDMGEQVKAVVQPADWDAAGPDLERELIVYCRAKLASLKCPKSIDFERELPRDDTGKLYKRKLRDRYWPGAAGGVK